MIELPDRIYEELLAHAREGAPAEVCGVLAGDFGAEESRVVGARRARNASPLPESRYEIDPAEAYRIVEAIEAGGDEVVGFYHSHPRGPAGPSATDAAEATWQHRSYVVVSLAGDPGVTSWRWTGTEFEAESVIRV